MLEYLEKFNERDLDLEKITLKTVMLLALSTAQRAQTITKIRLSNIKRVPDGLEIRIPDLLKTSGPGRFQPVLQLPFFIEKPGLCAVNSILLYLKQTALIRGDCNQLFISIKKPYHPVSTQTISKWIKKCLNNSGIDVSCFSGHSTRHATTSAAFARGMDFDTIRRTAGWSERSKTLARFYQRPIVTRGRDFATTVLLNNK